MFKIISYGFERLFGVLRSALPVPMIKKIIHKMNHDGANFSGKGNVNVAAHFDSVTFPRTQYARRLAIATR